MSMKKGTRETFRVMVRHVDLLVDRFQMHEVAISPFADRTVFYVHVTRASGLFLGITHSSASDVVLVEDSSSFLRNPKILHGTAYEDDHLSCIVRHHELRFGG
jgi:hypothetical protein